MKPVKDFLGKPAPAGYVAGAGRSGFTTRPDAVGDIAFAVSDDDADAGLLISRSADAEDAEADLAFAKVDQVMAGRRKKKAAPPEARGSAVADAFVDLKESLRTVSASQWAALPEAGDRRIKKKKLREDKQQRYERFTPLPDDMLLRSSSAAAGYTGSVNELDEGVFVRERMLGSSIDNLSTTSTGHLNADDYLHRLSQQVINESSLERARTLIRSMLKGNPDNASTWIAAVRLEVQAGKIKTGRAIARQAVGRLPESPALWLELAQISEDRRLVLMDALRVAGGAEWEEVWVAAVDCEQTLPGKQALLRRALGSAPHSVALWERMVSISGAAEEMSLLSRACAACPQAAQFWIRLSELETGENVQSVLHTALKKNPSCLDLWLCLLKHIASADRVKIVEQAIEQCRLSTDSSFPDCPESMLIIQHLVDTAGRESLWNHRNEMVRRCALQSSLAHISVEECREAVKKDRSLCPAALQLHPHDPDLWMEYLQDCPQSIDQAIRTLPHDARIWTVYLDQHPEDVDIARQAYQSAACADIAFHYTQLLRKQARPEWEAVLLEAVAKHPQHQGLLLMHAGDDEGRLKEALQTCHPPGVHLWIRACRQASKSPASFRAVWERANKAIPKHELLWHVHLCAAWHPSLAAHAVKACPRSGLLLSSIAAREQNRALRKSRALDALARLPGDPWVLLLVGRLLLEEGREVEGGEHVKRALACAGRYADIYAQCIVLCPELEADAKVMYKQNKPNVSARFPEQLAFDLCDLVESFRE